ncbi:MAG: hypothetical protein JSS49_22880 [Planctomycetes bacterium]|nr:hypothetical protein [Planctomycetota bacterium]
MTAIVRKLDASWRFRSRRIAIRLSLILGTWLIVEMVSLTAIKFLCGSLETHRKNLRVATAMVPDYPGGVVYPFSKLIHPYVGVIRQPTRPSAGLPIGGEYRVTEFGFVDVDSPIQKRSPDRLIVGILGGSVARQFSCNATKQLEEELLKCPEFAGRKCHFVRLAIDGCKQPQQLMILNHLLCQGAEFDLLINLDGLNEIALPGHDNLPFGINSAYPADWGMLTRTYSGDDYVYLLGRITSNRRQQRALSNWGLSFPQSYSPTAQLICRLQQDQLIEELRICLGQLTDLSNRRKIYAVPGPPESFQSPDEINAHFVETWYRSSIVLHRVCVANSIRYFHFLQPNQYLPGSKPMGPEETAGAIEVNSRTGAAVQACYPLMQAKRESFRQEGVAFIDLTGVFADEIQPLYSDGCCHLFLAGDLIMARAIGTQISQLITNNRPTPPTEDGDDR